MPRASSKPAANTASQIDTDALARDTATFDQRNSMVAQADAIYSVGVAYNAEAVIAQLHFVVASTGHQLLELGRLLVLIHEHEPPARFAEIVAASGLTERFARKTMRAAVKFTGNQAKALVGARLGSSKLLELVSEDDDGIETLGNGGTVAGLTLDDVDRMSVRDLKTALRKERTERAADREATDAIVEKKDKKLNSLERKLRGWEKTPQREKADELMKGVDEHVVDILAGFNKLEQSVAALYDVYGNKWDADVEALLETLVANLSTRMGEIEKQVGG